jgi:hypothetical protein
MLENDNRSGGIGPGAPVVIVLHTPREKFWGLLDEINSAGVSCRGLDLNSFDDWLASIVHAEPFIGVGDVFFPMWRIERIAKDEAAGAIPSLAEQVEKRTGRSVEQVLRGIPEDVH